MRNIYFLICFFLTIGTIGSFSPFFDINFSSSTASEFSYAVEIGKYKYPVYTNYFEEIDEVVELSGSTGEYHYLTGFTSSRKEAEELVTEIVSHGYTEAKLVDLEGKFSKNQIEDALNRQKDTEKTKVANQAVQKNKEAARVIRGLDNIGNGYFYSILLRRSNVKLSAKTFAPLQGVKPIKENGQYQYLYGRFEDVGDADAYMVNALTENFPEAKVVVVNNGVISKPRPAKINKAEKKYIALQSGLYNMGRKMRGKEYVDYYYELSAFGVAGKPSYVIEVGEYDDKKLADEAVQKLKDLGFPQAKIQKDSKKSNHVNKFGGESAVPHYSIQVFASKSKVDSKRLRIKNITRNFDQEDEVYRYFYGNYDNYWVCRRELREVRRKGFSDAFIVKL